MASTFSSQQTTHAFLLLLPLSSPLFLIPNDSVTNQNSKRDYFQKGENTKKGVTQDDLLALEILSPSAIQPRASATKVSMQATCD